MHDASRNHKQMKYRMHILMLSAQSIQYGTGGIGEPAAEKQHKAGNRQHLKQRLDCRDDEPPRTQIADHGQYPVFLQVYRVEYHAHDGTYPNNAKQYPREQRMGRPKPAQEKGRICACDHQKYGAVVDHLKNLFGRAMADQPVINAGHGIEDDHHAAIDGAGDDAPCVCVDGGSADTKDKRRKGECETGDMRGHIEDFLASGIIRYLSVFQLRSLHEYSSKNIISTSQ